MTNSTDTALKEILGYLKDTKNLERFEDQVVRVYNPFLHTQHATTGAQVNFYIELKRKARTGSVLLAIHRSIIEVYHKWQFIKEIDHVRLAKKVYKKVWGNIKGDIKKKGNFNDTEVMIELLKRGYIFVPKLEPNCYYLGNLEYKLYWPLKLSKKEGKKYNKFVGIYNYTKTIKG